MALNKLPSNASLKEAVTQTENINTEISTLKGKLKTNLVNKGVTATDSDKMSNLIDKVGDIEVERHNFPKWYDSKMGVWVKADSLPIFRMGFACCTIGTNIYCLGGYTGTAYVTETNIYDTINNTWFEGATKPTGSNYTVGCVIDGKIYTVCGQSASINKNEMYDPMTDTWTTKTKIPSYRNYLSLDSVGDKMYAVGGKNSNIVKETLMYDPMTDTWTTKANMLTARYDHSSSAVNDKIYIIGGSDFNDTTEMYDPITDTWSYKSQMIACAYNCTASVVGTNIYIIGGTSKIGTGGYANAGMVYMYDTINDTWTQRSSMNVPRTKLSSGAVGDNIYAIGGARNNDENKLSINECYIC